MGWKTLFLGKTLPYFISNIGKLKNDFYTLNHKTLQLPKHGFVKDMEWDLIEKQKDCISLKTNSSKETFEIFPFDFEITLNFKLTEKGLTVEHLVKNTGTNNLYFSIGAHPAFNIPFHKNSNFTDYQLVFEKNETCNEMNLNQDGFLLGTENVLLNQENTIALSEDLFYQDTVIIPNLLSKKITIENRKNNLKKLSFSWENFNYLAIWKPKNAPFLCLEPWQGLPDFDNHDGNWLNKIGNDCLHPHESKMYSWKMEVLE